MVIHTLGSEFSCIKGTCIHTLFYSSSWFLRPNNESQGHIVCAIFVCFVCIYFKVVHNFWTIKGRDFIFGMFTPIIDPCINSSDLVTLSLTVVFLYSALDFGRKFWTIKDGGFIFGTHFHQWSPFYRHQFIKVSYLLTLTFFFHTDL